MLTSGISAWKRMSCGESTSATQDLPTNGVAEQQTFTPAMFSVRWKYSLAPTCELDGFTYHHLPHGALTVGATFACRHKLACCPSPTVSFIC